MRRQRLTAAREEEGKHATSSAGKDIEQARFDEDVVAASKEILLFAQKIFSSQSAGFE